MKPAVGRIVHYYNHKGEGPSAAIVTDDSDEEVHLTVLKDRDIYFAAAVEGPIEGEGYWVWPPRQPE